MSTTINALKSDAKDMAAALLQAGIPFDVVRRNKYVVIATDKVIMNFSASGEMKECEKLKKTRNIGTKLED